MAARTITISENLESKVENDAKNLTRSFSQQVVHILKEYYTTQPDHEIRVLNKIPDKTDNG